MEKSMDKAIQRKALELSKGNSILSLACLPPRDQLIALRRTVDLPQNKKALNDVDMIALAEKLQRELEQGGGSRRSRGLTWQVISELRRLSKLNKC